MRTHRLAAGFKDLKTEFIGRTRTKKQIEQLSIWFSFENNVLSIHDYEEPQTFLILAVHNPKESAWKIFLRDGSIGKKVIDYAIEKWGPNEIESGMGRTFDLVKIQSLF